MKNPTQLGDYCPISCCYVLYKAISKVIANGLKSVLIRFISLSQSTFVPGRRIAENSLLAQEVLHNYHRNYGKPKMFY